MKTYLYTAIVWWVKAEQIAAPIWPRLAEIHHCLVLDTLGMAVSETWGMRGNSGYSLEASARKSAPWG